MDPLLIPLAALSIPIVVAPLNLALKHAQRVRELEHTERMRALDLGAVLPQDESWWTPTRLVVLLAAGIPTLALSLATSIWKLNQGPSDAAWMACGSVAVAGVIGGTYLAKYYHSTSQRMSAPPLKTPYDPDSFDAVDSRGYGQHTSSVN